MTTMHIEGLRETQQALKELDRKVGRSILRKGLRAGANVIKDAARAEAPEVTGLLKRSIKVRGGRTTKDSVSLTVATSAKDYSGQSFYSSFIEYGHKVGSRKLGDDRTEVAPNPYMLRAFDATKERAAQVAAETWASLIEANAD